MPMPSTLGGPGGRRVADNLNPQPPSPGRASYWRREEDVALLAARDRETRIRISAGAGVSGEPPTTDECVGEEAIADGSGVATSEAELDVTPDDTGSAASDAEDEEHRSADDASGQEIRDAILHLVRAMSEKAGARVVDRFLRLLRLKNLPDGLQILRDEGLDSVAAITKQLDSEVRETMKERGFRAVWVANPENNGEGVCVYLRDPVAVIERQMKKASVTGPDGRNFYFHPVSLESRATGKAVRTHPMSADLAKSILPSVRDEVMDSFDEKVMWDEERSFMCMLQMYTDKSAMSLSTKAHVFYPMHIAVLNLKSELKDSLIRTGETVVAYLSTSSHWGLIPDGAEVLHPRPMREIERGDPEAFIDTNNPGEDSQINKVLFRCSLAAVLATVKDVALRGVPFNDADGTPRLAHLVLAAYSGDMPEMHLLTCTKQNVCCPRCKIAGDKLCEPGAVGDMRTCSETKSRLQSVYSSVGAGARDEMWGGGWSTIEPALLGFPFMSIPGLDMYEIVRFDLLHCGPLGMLKHILRAVYERTKSKDLRTVHVLDAKKAPKTFSAISGRVLRACNEYLTGMEKTSPAVGFSVNFARGKKKSQLDGLFTDDGIVSMLEGKDYRMAQEVLPFVGVLLDRCLGRGYSDSESVPQQTRSHPIITEIFVLYQNMDQAIRRKDMEEVGFTDDTIGYLRSAMDACQKKVLKVLGPFQKSGFKFVKFHSYNHLVRDILALGLASGFDTSMFEGGHPVYKGASKATSRRHGSATADATTIISRNECTRAQLSAASTTSNSGRIVQELVNGASRRGARVPRSVEEAVHDDVAVLPANGMKCNWQRLADVVSEYYKAPPDVEPPLAELQHLINRQEKRYARGMTEFVALLRDPDVVHKTLQVVRKKALLGDGTCPQSETDPGLDDFEKHDALRDLTITVLKSARLAGHPAPSLSHVTSTGSVFLPGGGSGYRLSQRVISSASFSHGKRLFQERVMIDGNRATHSGRGEDECYQWEVWFAEALAFLRIHSSIGPMSNGKGEEYVVVRYFEVIRPSDLDAVDRATDCIKLKWARDPSSGNDEPPEEQQPWIDVVPATSIRGRVHVVDEPCMPDMTATQASRKDEPEPGEWTRKAFYVNKYKLSNYEPSYHTDDRVKY